MIANMKRRQSTLIGVGDAVFQNIRNGPSHCTTMCRDHTGQLVWLKIIRHRREDYKNLISIMLFIVCSAQSESHTNQKKHRGTRECNRGPFRETYMP